MSALYQKYTVSCVCKDRHFLVGEDEIGTRAVRGEMSDVRGGKQRDHSRKPLRSVRVAHPSNGKSAVCDSLFLCHISKDFKTRAADIVFGQAGNILISAANERGIGNKRNILVFKIAKTLSADVFVENIVGFISRRQLR